MKLKKSMLLSIALLGSSASIFSYATVYDIRGNDANSLGNEFKRFLAQAVGGDEIVLHNNVNLLRETGKLDIPNITIRSINSSRLHIEGANLNLTGSATFKDLNLSLKPDSGLMAAFGGLTNTGPNAQPTLIVTNGHSLTFDNVNTKVDGDNDGTRPIILVGGGNAVENEVLTITNSTSESKLYSIVVDKTKKLNTAGNAFSTNDNPSEKEITIKLDANSRVLNDINLAGIDRSQNPSNKISINSETLNIGKLGNSSKDGIHIGGASNVHLSFSNIEETVKEVKIQDNNVRLKTLVLDNAKIVLKKNANVDTLELKNNSKFNVTSTSIYVSDDEITIPYNISLNSLKTDGTNNIVDIVDSSTINANSLEGNASNLTVTGTPDKFTLTDNSSYTYNDGTFTRSKEEPESPPQPPESPSTQPDSNDEEAENSSSGTQPENQPSAPSNTENPEGDNSSTESNQPTETGTGESEGTTETGETVDVEDDSLSTNEDNSNVDSSTDEADTAPDKSEESVDTPNTDSSATPSELGGTTGDVPNTQDKPSSPTDDSVSNGTNSENSGKDEESSNENSPIDNPQGNNDQSGATPTVDKEDESPSTSDHTVNSNAGTNEADAESAENPNSTEDSKEQNSASSTDEQSGNDEQGKENQEQPSGVVDTNTETGKSEVTDNEGADTNSSDTSNESQPANSNTESPSVDGSENANETSNGSSDTEDNNKQPEENTNDINSETITNGGPKKEDSEVAEEAKDDKAEGATESKAEEPKEEDSVVTELPEDDKAENVAESQPEESKEEDSEVAEQPEGDNSEVAEQPKVDKAESATESQPEEPQAENSEVAELPEDDKVESATESKPEEPKSEVAGEAKDDKAENVAESQPEESKEEDSVVAEQPTDLSTSLVSNSEGKSDEKADKPEMLEEKQTEKSIKDRIIDTLKGWFTSNKVDEKQQPQVVEKTEESLKNLVEMYTDYDFSFSFDATRVAENRLNELAMSNGLESAANNHYTFLAQSTRALQNHNSVWVSSSLTEQRGDSKRRLNTINLGYDKHFDNLILGGFVSYLRQKGERGELSSKLHGYAFSLYGKYNQNSHEVVALLNAGRTKADLQRNISAFGINNQADAKGKFIGLKVEYGYRMPFDAHSLQIKPLIGLNYNLGRQAAFTEYGAMPVHVDKIKAQRLAVEAGVELRKYFETAYVYVKPTLQTEVMARSNDVNIRFTDTPNSIPFKSAAKKKTYFALSLGTQLQLRKNLLLDLNANSRIGKHERDIQGSIKLNYKF